MNGVNYDNWLNRYNPYDRDYEIEEEREYHLENISVLKTEEDIEEYIRYHITALIRRLLRRAFSISGLAIRSPGLSVIRMGTMSVMRMGS
jgi:hypothetical protein